MLNSQNLIDKICAKITGGGLTALETCQMNGALAALCAPVCSVPTFNNLPSATDNLGRMIYVHAENRYYYAFGGLWLNDFQSTIYNYDDSAWVWGSNVDGRLGDNTTANRSSPVSVAGGFSDWRQASAGGSFTVAVRQNDTTWGWGCNSVGQIGDNTTIDRSSPVSVVGGFSDWCQLSAGGGFAVAVRTNSTVWSWGLGTCGRLGDNTTTNRSSPVSVVGGFTDWCQASAGGAHTVAVRTGGSAWAWGINSFGQLGDNTVTSRTSPVSVVGGFSDWCQLSAGGSHTVAVRTNSTVWSWGYNAAGRLGDGNTSIATRRSSPVSVLGGFTDWCQASAGDAHTIAVRSQGSAWGWGCNACGRLGDNTTANRSSPVSVVGGFSDWCQISAGCQHSAGIRQETKGF